jgi:hypothetical protein
MAMDLYQRSFEFTSDAPRVVWVSGRNSGPDGHVEAMSGCDRDELLGQAIEIPLPALLAEGQVEHRNPCLERHGSHPVGTRVGLFGRCKNQSENPVGVMRRPFQGGPRRRLPGLACLAGRRAGSPLNGAAAAAAAETR